jgi:hypothetical protein
LIGGGLARLAGKQALPWARPPAAPFWPRHRLVDLILLAGACVMLAWVLLVGLAGPAQAGTWQQDTTSSAGSSDDSRGGTSQTPDRAAPAAASTSRENIPTVDARPAARPSIDEAGTANAAAGLDLVATDRAANAPSHRARKDRGVAPAVADPARARDRSAAAHSLVPVASEAEESPESADASARGTSVRAWTTYPGDSPPTRAPSRSDPQAETVEAEACARTTDDLAPSAHPTFQLAPLGSLVATSPGCSDQPPDSGYSKALTASPVVRAGGWTQSEPEWRRGAMWSPRDSVTPVTPVPPARPLTPPAPPTLPAPGSPPPLTSASGFGSGTGPGEHLDDLATLASCDAVVPVQAWARIASGATGRVVRGVDDPRGHPD